jgi:excinuclease ABC subunit A
VHPEVRFPDLSPRLFSFNSPYGACPDCDGLGTVLEFDPELAVPDQNLSLMQGAVRPWSTGHSRSTKTVPPPVEQFCEQFGVEAEAPLRNLSEDIRRILIHGTTPEDQEAFGASFEGVIPGLRRRWQATASESLKARLHAYLSESPCLSCGGARLGPAARAVQVGGRGIDAVVRLNITAVREWCEGLSFDGEHKLVASPLLAAIVRRLRFLEQVGLAYLTLDRRSVTLSGGEAQRIRLATQVGSGLVGVCYVLDEPTIGLHPRDSSRLVQTLKELRNMGNTVLVVEHDEVMIRAAEHVVDIGPAAGQNGGEIMAEGTLETILGCERSLTGQYLSGSRRIELPAQRRPVSLDRALEIRGARAHNLKNIDVHIPLGVLTCVTGVSGSGKSTLVNDIVVRALRRKLEGTGRRPAEFERLAGGHHIHKVVEIDQSPIGRSPRSNPATYIGVFDLIRQLYARTREAKIRGYPASRFSFNVKGGRCEACQGHGTKRIEMHFLPPVFVTCDSCKGSRYSRQTLDVRYRGRHIAGVLDMTVSEAKRFFDSFARITQRLQLLADVGMGYVTLGQASNTLSGGEAQRVKLAAELGRDAPDHTLYVLDEPTTGLHFADIDKLLAVLNRLVDQGNTVLVIEHNLDVIKIADWVIDLGPDGGDEGGELVTAGTPEDVAAHRGSHTGRYLKPYLRSVAAATR